MNFNYIHQDPTYGTQIQKKLLLKIIKSFSNKLKKILNYLYSYYISIGAVTPSHQALRCPQFTQLEMECISSGILLHFYIVSIRDVTIRFFDSIFEI